MGIDRFSWRSWDVNSLLRAGWRQELIDIARKYAQRKILLPRSVTSREGDPNLKIIVETVNGIRLKEVAPWVNELYQGVFRDLAQAGIYEPVTCAEELVYGAVLNVQHGSAMRYESHVDSNPIEGLLYVTDHPKNHGGELVVANNPTANSISEIDADCSVIYPVSGNLIFFDARRFPHYVRALLGDADIRVVVAMNYYTPSCPESARPADLNNHLFGYTVQE